MRSWITINEFVFYFIIDKEFTIIKNRFELRLIVIDRS